MEEEEKTTEEAALEGQTAEQAPVREAGQGQETGEASGQEPEEKAEAGYPPGTYQLMSWSSIRFINRPSSRLLLLTAAALCGLALVGVTATVLIQVNLKIAAVGEVAAYPEVKRVVVQTEGLLAELRKASGDPVRTGDVIAVLQMGLTEAEIEAMLRRLKANVPLAEAANRRAGLAGSFELGEALAGLRDPELLDASSSLQAIHRELRQSLLGLGEYEKDKNSFIRSSRLLEGKLSAYLERRRVRATCNGSVAALHATLNANLKSGDPVASVLPEGSSLVVRSKVESRYIPDLRVGQKAMHKLEAFPYQRFGVFEGEVLAIDQVLSGEGAEIAVSYVLKSSVRPPANIRLALGMKAQSHIVTRRERVCDVIIDRLFGAFKR